MIEDPYKVLGISRDAAKDEIKRAYRKKAKECHPDLHPNDPKAAEKMNEINEAYDMLNNPEKYKKQEQESYQHRETYGNGYETGKPKVEPGDSEDIRQAIDFINMGRYGYANNTLNSVVSNRRNARWYYLSALANAGLGNTILAAEQIDKAVRMEPNNQVYQQTRQSFYMTGNLYNEAGQEFWRYAEGMNRLCMGFCATQFFFLFCCR